MIQRLHQLVFCLRPWPLALACLLIATAMAPAYAAEKFEISSASVTAKDGVYLLNAKLRFTLPNGARQAIVDGVPLTLAVQIELQRARRWWLDESVAALELRYDVLYHALSEQYLLRNLNSGEQTTYATLDAALDALAELRDVPVLDQSLLDVTQDYEIRLRASLDVRTLPDTLRMVLFWTDDWRQRTDWYLWAMKP